MYQYISILALFVLATACYHTSPYTPEQEPIDPEYQKYWYNNEAEISSYSLQQARYGEIHEGQAALVFVTEHFSRKSNAKADKPTNKDVPVMKLNLTKKFYTGVYPYSMMTSTFFPFSNGTHSLKISSSSQEWCGHTFMELKQNRTGFDIKLDSYFEGESKDDVKLGKALLEDDLWTKIRLTPSDLPIGDTQMIPSFFYLRLAHKEIKSYVAQGSLAEEAHHKIYTLKYPDLERQLQIYFEKQFPYKILGWEEDYYSGWGDDRKKLTSSASILSTVKSDYWNRHGVRDSVLRTELKLK